MKQGFSPGQALRLVHSVEVAADDWAWFCGRCAHHPELAGPPAPHARVCPSCSLGLLLEAPSSSAPEPGDAFLVIDNALTVQAMSQAAEKLLGLDEELAINRPAAELLMPADSEGSNGRTVVDAISEALGGNRPVGAFVRPWNTFGLRLRARVVGCGPPRAALLMLDCPLRRAPLETT